MGKLRPNLGALLRDGKTGFLTSNSIPQGRDFMGFKQDGQGACWINLRLSNSTKYVDSSRNFKEWRWPWHKTEQGEQREKREGTEKGRRAIWLSEVWRPWSFHCPERETEAQGSHTHLPRLELQKSGRNHFTQENFLVLGRTAEQPTVCISFSLQGSWWYFLEWLQILPTGRPHPWPDKRS